LQNRIESCQARLILASSSHYRKIQLQHLVSGFEIIAPDVDESPLATETVAALVERLALAKATQIAASNPDALVVGSDQAARLGSEILSKPGNRENARNQLSKCAGNTVIFETAVALVQVEKNLQKLSRVTTRVTFRELTADEIFRYVEKDNPVDCAGSFKLESGAAVLFESVESSDPTALIGLPLIATSNLLRSAGIAVP